MNNLLYQRFPHLGFASDFRLVGFPNDYLTKNQELLQQAYTAMHDLEHGAIANPDENRMVGHYWLRNPDLAPTSDLTKEILILLTR